VASSRGTGGSFGEAFRAGLRAAATPRASYTAQGSVAQYKHLMKTAAGREALAAVGMTAAGQTRRRWLGGRQNPGKANAGKIGAAYTAMQKGFGSLPKGIRNGKMHITGSVGTGRDIRDRGSRGNARLEINLQAGDWTRIDRLWWDDDLISDLDLEDVVADDLVDADIETSEPWYFGGSSYTIDFTY
jgi:hypothetical protein